MTTAVGPTPRLDIEVHHDLVALPGRYCLYDLTGRRVDSTVHWTLGRPLGPAPATAPVDIDLKLVEGPVIYGGLVPKPHFGHFLLEAFARLWPYFLADRRGVPHVHHLHWGRDLLPFESTLFEAALGGMDTELLRIDEPTRYRTVLVPSQGIVLEHAIPAEMLGIYDRIRDRLAGPTTLDDRPLYLSRSRVGDGRRRTLGEVSLERRLESEGFRIVHPQELPLAEQIRTVAGARTVVGLFGSALHLTIFRDMEGARTLALTPRTPSRIQYEIDRVRGARSEAIRTELPIHPRHPRINRGRSISIGPWRNLLLPGRATRNVHRALSG